MKRCICLLLAALLLLLTACQSGTVEATSTPEPTPTAAPTPAPTATPEPTPEPEPEFTNPLTGLATETDLSGRKPVAIMLNNLKQALPQQGNSQADIIYEVLAEGGITRMLAVYQDVSAVGAIGSVRSARLYYLELALGHDAVFIHAGGSPEFYTAKNNLGVTTVDGVRGYYSGASAGIFWRDRRRIEGKNFAYEHSLLTSGENITTTLTARGLLGDHAEGYSPGLTFTKDGTPADGQTATTVTVPFSNYKTGVFRYDQASGLYAVEEYGQPYIDGNDGSQVAVTNLLILQADTTVVDSEGRLEVELTSGSGWFACGGKLVPITWVKNGRYEPLRYCNADGSQLTLGQGRSYVCIIPTSREITAE